MIIDNAAIKMQAGHHQQQRTGHKESLNIWNNRVENRSQSRSGHIHKDKLKLSDAAKLAATQKKTSGFRKTAGS
jgi:hypothetical protein